MIPIEPADFEPLAEFDLRWRWTDATWNLLSDDELSLIRPLNGRKAAELSATLSTLIDPVPLRICVNTGTALREAAEERCVKTFDTSGDAATTAAWLRATLPSQEGDVLASWSPETAVVVELALFIRYWDDFCYPLSHDVVVVPPSGEWILYYFHEETFYFWTR